MISLDQREIPNYWSGGCFGCSPANLRGLQLRFWRSEKGCFTRCTITDELCGWGDLVHGGIIAVLLDEVAAWTIITHIARLGLTRKISIRYLRPVRTNTELTVEGQLISHDDRAAVLRSTVHSAGGDLLAESESTWTFPKLSTVAKIAGVDESTLQKFLAGYLSFGTARE